MFDPVHVHVITSFGDCSVSRFCPKYWAVLHRLAGAQQVVSEPGDWRLTTGSLVREGITGRRLEMPILCKSCSAMDAGRFDGLMDAGVQTNEDTGRLGAL